MNSIIKSKSITQLKGLLKSLNGKKVFLVTGGNFYEKCGAKSYIETISSEFIFHRFYEFQDNPKIEDVKEGIRQLILFGADIIVAIGGGSIIDMAKLINGLYQIDREYINNSIIENKIKTPVLPLIAIPTTAGSGSESTHFAVVYIGKNKYSLAHQVLIPNHVILDTELLKSQSTYQIAVSGIDAFSQAIESLWSVNSTDESIQYSKRAIELLWFYLPKLIEGQNDTNLFKVMEGAHLAGKAINIAKTTAPHALAYGFTTHFGLPHGHAVALSLPYFVDLHLNVNSENCLENRGVLRVIEKLKLISECIEKPYLLLPVNIANFIRTCGLELNFSKLGIDKINFIKATNSVNIERLINNPVKVDTEVIMKLYYCKLN